MEFKVYIKLFYAHLNPPIPVNKRPSVPVNPRSLAGSSRPQPHVGIFEYSSLLVGFLVLQVESVL